MMKYHLFLDDLRTVQMVYPHLSEKDFVVVRTYEEFVNCIRQKGLPAFISFDNDLGEDEEGNLLPDGYAASKWLVYESGLDLQALRFKVHSANPVAREYIESLLTNYINFLKNETQ
ncbi:cyclic-phosphate processing receiver domain-containing protein [Rapidithrix thailandica]|uniref:Cyclic-phosphate processing receiver domain-containing protein n=1 Tax=Rapidithrix thailandica TaxID=413964 RepID=A0AAW9SGY3_9BACT